MYWNRYVFMLDQPDLNGPSISDDDMNYAILLISIYSNGILVQNSELTNQNTLPFLME